MNADIARLLKITSSGEDNKLNSMENALINLLDFDLFVSEIDYNKEAFKLNKRV